MAHIHILVQIVFVIYYKLTIQLLPNTSHDPSMNRVLAGYRRSMTRTSHRHQPKSRQPKAVGSNIHTNTTPFNLHVHRSAQLPVALLSRLLEDYNRPTDAKLQQLPHRLISTSTTQVILTRYPRNTCSYSGADHRVVNLDRTRTRRRKSRSD